MRSRSRTRNIAFGLAVALAAGIVVALAPLPIQSSSDVWTVRLTIAAALLVLAGAAVTGLLFRKFASTARVFVSTLFLLAIYATFGRISHSLSLPVSIAACAVNCALLGAVSGKTPVPASGLFSLILAIGFFFGAEHVLQEAPASVLLPEIKSTPLLALPDRGREMFRNGIFRGKRPCRDCPDTIRIMTMGGSSTYGLPLHHARRAYPEVLQRMLNERRPVEKYEVLNAGMAGMGIIQVLDTLKETVTKYNPKIVTICSWFNDNGPIPGWYGIPEKSDRDAYLMNLVLWKVQSLPGYMRIHNTRLFAVFRYYLLRLRDTFGGKQDKQARRKLQRRPRSTPEEFEWALREIIKLGDRHGFLPVLILEPLNHTQNLEKSLEKNRYYRVMEKLARQYNLPLVDPLTRMSAEKDASLFYDFIHPNIEGHRLIAEEIYNTLFSANAHPGTRSFFARAGVKHGQPEVRREWLFQYDTSTLEGSTLRLKVQFPYAGAGKHVAALLLNNNPVAVQENEGQGEGAIEYTFGNLAGEAPICDISVRAMDAQGGREKSLLAVTEVRLTVNP